MILNAVWCLTEANPPGQIQIVQGMLTLQSAPGRHKTSIEPDLGTKFSQNQLKGVDAYLKSHERIDDRMILWGFSVQPTAIRQSGWRRSLLELDVRWENGLW